MKILEMIWATLLVILSVAMTIWQIIEKSPAFVIIFLAVLSVMAGIVLRKVLKEFFDERKQKQ